MKTHINIFIPKPWTPQKKAVQKELKSLGADQIGVKLCILNTLGFDALVFCMHDVHIQSTSHINLD